MSLEDAKKITITEPITSNKLRVFFRGLSVFADGLYESKPKVDVLLVDARKPEELLGNYYHFDNPGDTDIPNNIVLPHIPMVSIPKALFKDKDEEKYLPKYKIGDDYVLPLTKYRIEITKEDDTSFSGGVETTEDFYKLIPNLKILAPSKDLPNPEIDPDVLDPTKLDKLSGFLEIKAGTIDIPNSQSLDMRRATDFIKTTFDDDYKFKPQLLANCVYWEVIIPPQGFTGTEYPFKIKLYNTEGEEQRTFELTLAKDPTTNKPIPGYIFITNMPSSGIEINKEFEDKPDLDFALAYQVLKYPVYEPLPRKVGDPDEPQTLPPLFCAIARFGEQ